ncbi:SHOCT domain-containing protein [Pandoraea communis]|uniref:SHOCT domain-containing protein n=2 Tax=Pandoraea TaxID=93217 RepID=A0A5E4U1Q6_9BURK|nr:SHOCT domain-containing protein [Pandoraea communis]EON11258.1 hypothetical protein C266_22565 [Pandoraea sp. SD6-2]MDM8355110.1 SHOCT domain-containing protein [Pandoraea communis]VVD92978.1 hypothetical protein PCO31111_01729 [Pandoraea communis]
MMGFGQPGGWGYGMMGGGFGWLLVLLIVAVFVVALGLFRRSSHCQRDRSARSRSALDILDDRYARGEIDADEYKKRRADLEG